MYFFPLCWCIDIFSRFSLISIYKYEACVLEYLNRNRMLHNINFMLCNFIYICKIECIMHYCILFSELFSYLGCLNFLCPKWSIMTYCLAA